MHRFAACTYQFAVIETYINADSRGGMDLDLKILFLVISDWYRFRVSHIAP
jgi:hypothetical protein